MSCRYLTNAEQPLRHYLKLQRLTQAYKRRKIQAQNVFVHCNDLKHQDACTASKIISVQVRTFSTEVNPSISTNDNDSNKSQRKESIENRGTSNSSQFIASRTNSNLDRVLRQYYDKVSKALGGTPPCTGIQRDKSNYIEYEYIVNWPTKASFKGRGKTVQEAKHRAARICLEWLRESKKVTVDNSPIFYTPDAVKDALAEPVTLALSQNELRHMNKITLVYEKRIAQIVENRPKCKAEPVKRVKAKLNHLKNTVTDIVKRNHCLKTKLLRDQGKCNLTINEYRDEIANTIRENNRVIIIGETGCGKSTQVPQFILDDYIMKSDGSSCNILITQPRRLLAISLAKYVSKERNEPIAYSVGYSIRLEYAHPENPGTIIFCTPGVIVERLMHDPNLEGVTHLILDEVHEQTVQIDLLLTMLKVLQRQRPDLKAVFMSATPHVDSLHQFFGTCPVVSVPGKRFPVEPFFLDTLNNTTIKHQLKRYKTSEVTVIHENVVNTIRYIVTNKPFGTILCFLPQWKDIIIVWAMLNASNMTRSLRVIPIHSKMPSEQQLKIYDSGENEQKVILATNIAESGLTIPDVVYVVDTAIIKKVVWDPDTDMLTTTLSWASKANIMQRQGRAGRMQKGESYHLINKSHYNSLTNFPEPEMSYIPLHDILLKAKALTNLNVKQLCNMFPTPPEPSRVHKAVYGLKRTGALDEHEELTNLGSLICRTQLSVPFAKAAIYSKIFHCAHSVISLCTLFSYSEVFKRATVTKKEMKRILDRIHPTSDHVGALLAVKACMNDPKNTQLYQDYNIDGDKLAFVQKVVEKLYLELPGHTSNDPETSLPEFTMHQDNQYSDEYELVRGILYSCTGRLAKYISWESPDGLKTFSRLYAEDSLPTMLRATSINSQKVPCSSPFYTYINRIQSTTSTDSSILDSSLISILSVILFNHAKIVELQHSEKKRQNEVIFILESMPHIKFRSTINELEVLKKFRNVMWALVEYNIDFYASPSAYPESDVRTVMTYKNEFLNVLTSLLREHAKNIDKGCNVHNS